MNNDSVTRLLRNLSLVQGNNGYSRRRSRGADIPPLNIKSQSNTGTALGHSLMFVPFCGLHLCGWCER